MGFFFFKHFMSVVKCIQLYWTQFFLYTKTIKGLLFLWSISITTWGFFFFMFNLNIKKWFDFIIQNEPGFYGGLFILISSGVGACYLVYKVLENTLGVFFNTTNNKTIEVPTLGPEKDPVKNFLNALGEGFKSIGNDFLQMKEYSQYIDKESLKVLRTEVLNQGLLKYKHISAENLAKLKAACAKKKGWGFDKSSPMLENNNIYTKKVSLLDNINKNECFVKTNNNHNMKIVKNTTIDKIEANTDTVNISNLSETSFFNSCYEYLNYSCNSLYQLATLENLAYIGGGLIVVGGVVFFIYYQKDLGFDKGFLPDLSNFNPFRPLPDSSLPDSSLIKEVVDLTKYTKELSGMVYERILKHYKGRNITEEMAEDLMEKVATNLGDNLPKGFMARPLSVNDYLLCFEKLKCYTNDVSKISDRFVNNELIKQILEKNDLNDPNLQCLKYLVSLNSEMYSTVLLPHLEQLKRLEVLSYMGMS